MYPPPSQHAESSRSAHFRNQQSHQGISEPHKYASLVAFENIGTDNSRNEEGGSSDGAAETSQVRKRQKVTRARNACLPCRTRKCRCGGTPPDPCSSCIKDEIPCAWPTEDGRSAQARKERRKSKVQRQIGAQPTVSPDGDQWNWMMNMDWLDALSTPAGNGNVDQSGISLPDFSNTTQQYPNDLSSFDLPRLDQPTLPTQSTSEEVLTLDGLSNLGWGNAATANLPNDANDFLTSTTSPDWLSAFDPSSFVLAMSSKLPTVEEGSLTDEPLPFADFASSVGSHVAMGEETRAKRAIANSNHDKIVKVTWWRPHGQTAIAPGLKRIILKVRVDGPSTNSQAPTPISATGEPLEELMGADKMPNPLIMKHLLNVFEEHFGSQFPFLDHGTLETTIDAGTGSVFLFLCIAAIASRFSTHPSIALPNLKPHEYGSDFHRAAKDLLGSMLAVPSRETVMGLVLMAHLGLGTDSEAEEWMFTGMAVRMAHDLGLHLDPPIEANIPAQERRLNRLVFWSVVLLDFALSFGTGRQTTLRVEEITQPLPTDQDVLVVSKALPTTPRSPFPFAAKQMLAYGHLITILNSGRTVQEESERAIQLARTRAIQEYNDLPPDMQWNVTNLQAHSRAHQAPIYLHLHLWMHTIIASGYLTGTDYLRRPHGKSPYTPGSRSGAATPNTLAASHLWRNSARTIGDILVLSDIIQPTAYLSLPFCNQAFFVAGCCYVKEIEQDRGEVSRTALPPGLTMTPTAPAARRGSTSGDKEAGKPLELFKALVTSVAANNISTMQQGLSKQMEYWSGIAWVAEALAQRMAGIGASDIDLASVTDKLASSVYVCDPGVIHSAERRYNNSGDVGTEPPTSGVFLDLPPNMAVGVGKSSRIPLNLTRGRS